PPMEQTAKANIRTVMVLLVLMNHVLVSLLVFQKEVALTRIKLLRAGCQRASKWVARFVTTVLAYNLQRAIGMLGVPQLIAAVR
ncbi:MAG: hypothetical protein ABSA97_04850, partial [Verrucomicrobiia bacterium]